MSHVFPRSMKSLPPRAMRGEGCYLFDDTGKAYLDGSGGAAVSCLGHGDPDVIAAVQKQAAALSFAHTGFSPVHRLRNLPTCSSRKLRVIWTACIWCLGGQRRPSPP